MHKSLYTFTIYIHIIQEDATRIPTLVAERFSYIALFSYSFFIAITLCLFELPHEARYDPHSDTSLQS